MKKFDTRLINYPKKYRENITNPASVNTYRYYDKLTSMIMIHYI
jgi:hypothetical protein